MRVYCASCFLSCLFTAVGLYDAQLRILQDSGVIEVTQTLHASSGI